MASHLVNSYIVRAGDTTYFDLGSEKWNDLKKDYGLTDNDLFQYFNVPALDEAIASGKTIRFSHDPRLLKRKRKKSLWKEWQHLREKLNLDDGNLVLRGDFYVIEN